MEEKINELKVELINSLIRKCKSDETIYEADLALLKFLFGIRWIYDIVRKSQYIIKWNDT